MPKSLVSQLSLADLALVSMPDGNWTQTGNASSNVVYYPPGPLAGAEANPNGVPRATLYWNMGAGTSGHSWTPHELLRSRPGLAVSQLCPEQRHRPVVLGGNRRQGLPGAAPVDLPVGAAAATERGPRWHHGRPDRR